MVEEIADVGCSNCCNGRVRADGCGYYCDSHWRVWKNLEHSTAKLVKFCEDLGKQKCNFDDLTNILNLLEKDWWNIHLWRNGILRPEE